MAFSHTIRTVTSSLGVSTDKEQTTTGNNAIGPSTGLLDIAVPGTMTEAAITYTYDTYQSSQVLHSGNTVATFTIRWVDAGVAKSKHGCVISATPFNVTGGVGDTLPTSGASITVHPETIAPIKFHSHDANSIVAERDTPATGTSGFVLGTGARVRFCNAANATLLAIPVYPVWAWIVSSQILSGFDAAGVDIAYIVVTDETVATEGSQFVSSSYYLYGWQD